MELQKTYDEQISTQLEEIDRNIEELSAKADQVSADMRDEFNTQVAILRARQAATHDQLQQVIAKGSDATDDLKNGLSQAIGDLKQALATANDRLN
jgi:hypothetical protein